MVIPSEREVNYHIFMYTMYNSNAPSLRQLAEFMKTDLGFKQLEVGRGWLAAGCGGRGREGAGSFFCCGGCSRDVMLPCLWRSRTSLWVAGVVRFGTRSYCICFLSVACLNANPVMTVGLLFLLCLQFMAGPGNDTMTIKRLLSKSWQFMNVITTARTFVAPKLPVPPRPFVLTKSGPAPLVQAINDCATFNVSCAVCASCNGWFIAW